MNSKSIDPSRAQGQAGRPLVLALSAWGTVLSLCLLVPSGSLGQVGIEQQQSRDSALAEMRAELVTLEEQLERVQAKKMGVAGELIATDAETRVQTQRLELARSRLGTARERLDATNVSIADLEESLRGVRDAIGRRLSGMYRMGSRGTLRLALSAKASDDLLGVARTLRFLVSRDARLREALVGTRTALAGEQVELAAQQDAIELLVNEESAKLSDLRILRQRRAALLSRLELDEGRLSTNLKGSLERQARLSELVDSMQPDQGKSLTGRDIAEFRGILDRPVVGSIVLGFGPQKDRRYNTLVPHNGLRFVTPPEERVQTIFPGKVLFADDLDGYGLTVVVLHAGKVYSLYAGLGRLEVKTDELVSLGQSLGRAGSELYFEVREDREPVDPLEWTR